MVEAAGAQIFEQPWTKRIDAIESPQKNARDELVRMNTELFADKVLPGLRGRWPGYEDRWWPRACS